MNLVLKVFSPFTADLQIPNSDRVSGVALSLLLIEADSPNKVAIVVTGVGGLSSDFSRQVVMARWTVA